MSLEKKLKKAQQKNNINELNNVFNDIYLEYAKLVYFLISKNVTTKEDIEDLVDTVFVNFYNKIKTTQIENIKYYLVVMSKNISINFLKRQKIDYIELNDNFIYENVNYSINDEYLEIIEEMKEVLTNFEIEIILQHLIYDYSFKELSYKYNKPLKTIYSLYSRSIKKFKKYKEESIYDK